MFWLCLSISLLGFTACKDPISKDLDAGKKSKPKTNSSAPTISAINNVTTAQDQSFTVNFTIADQDGALDCQSSIYISASNYVLFPAMQATRSGTYPNCSVTFQPTIGLWGTSTIEIQVYDGASSASSAFVATVSEGNTTPTVAASSANEGSLMPFTIRLKYALPGPKTYNYATSDGTALAGTHYSSTSGSVTFATGETVKVINVPTTSDNQTAPNRNFNFTVTNGVDPVTASGTIINTDAAPTASAAGVGVSEGTNLVFTVNLNRSSTTNTIVTYSTSDGTALAGTNYTATSGTLTFTPGQTSKTVTVPSQDDGTYTSNLTFTLSLTTNSVTSTATGTIVDAHGPPTATAANVTANEGSNLVFTVNLSHASSTSQTVTYSTSNGTASAGTNYISTSGTLTFTPGQTSKTVTVASSIDNVYTPNLTFTLGMTVNAVTNTATGTITNTDSAPTASAVNETVNEGSSLTFTVTLNRASATATSVTYATSNGTATAGTNYTAVSGTLSFSAGQTSKTLTITSLADNKYTADLNFSLDLTANAVTNTATGTIANTDSAPVPSVADVSANEGSNLVFTVTLNRASSTSTSVNYATANGTALSGTNYTAASGTLTFNAGETSKTVSVTSLTDSLHTSDLSFTLSATANSVTDSGTGTIVNTDAAPIATVNNVSVNEGGNLSFTVTLDRTSANATTVTYSTSDLTARASINYVAASGTVTIPAGQTTDTITVTTLTDSTYSTNLTLTLNVTANSVARSGTGTVINTDAVPTISIASVASAVTEGNSAGFAVTLNRASALDVQFNYATANGTASSGSDFAAASGTATITAGNLTANIGNLTYDDNTDEQDEGFSMQISAVQNANLGTASASVTIQDTSLYFDFTTGSLPSGLTFARTGTATYHDSSGLIQTAATNTPRFDYNPTSCAGTCTMRGLLIEESRTNLLLQSSTFGTTWVNSGLTLTANSTTSPSGATDADTLQSTTGGNNNTNNISQAVTLLANTAYTLSFYVKNSSALRSVYEVDALNSGTTGKSVTIDWTGTVPSASGGTVTALPNDWYRVSVSFTTNASDGGAATVLYYPSITLDNGFVYLWGAQLEAGSTPTSYIATTTTTVTRNEDSLSIDNFATWFNATTWTAIIDLSRPIYEAASSSATPVLFSSCDDTSGGTCASDFFQAVHLPSDNTFRGRSYVASANVATSNYTNAANLNGVKVQMGVSVTSAGALQTVVNGTAATASGAAAKPVTYNFILGASGRTGSYTQQINGHLKKFTYRSRALTASQLQAMTSD